MPRSLGYDIRAHSIQKQQSIRGMSHSDKLSQDGYQMAQQQHADRS
jgi:hypothetical protein